MPVVISLDIYSGVPNPAWELSDAQAERLRGLLQAEKQPSHLRSPADEGRLGYRGFEIYTVGELSLPKVAHVFDGILQIGDELAPSYVDADSLIERFLLETAGRNLTEEQKKYVGGEIEKNARGGIGSTFKDLEIVAMPPYDPGKWNNDPNIKRQNNCYNYANDKITNSFAQPGRGSGQVGPYPPSCSGTGAAAEHDGQLPTSSASSPLTEGHFIALVIWPGHDYHWYRLDDGGMWSHKPGRRSARNTDHQQKPIADPQSCHRGPYSSWCGYYHCIPSQTLIG
jgi:hypothetical protein